MATLQEASVLTPEQVAEYLQISRDTVYRYIREGKLAAVKLGRSYRVPRENLDLFMVMNSTKTYDRETRFQRMLDVAKNAPAVPFEEVEKDVAEAVAWARRRRRD